MNYLEEVNNWLEPVNEGKTVTVQIKRNGKIIFNKQYNSQDVQQFYKMMDNKDPIFFKGEELPNTVFSPDIVWKIEDTKDGGKIVHLKKSQSRAMVFKKNISIAEGKGDVMISTSIKDLQKEIERVKSSVGDLQLALAHFQGEKKSDMISKVERIKKLLGDLKL
jgi:hypothetical protein